MNQNRRQELEAKLAAEPFDPVRSEYALLLETSGDIEAALKQFTLLIKHDAGITAHFGEVRCLLALGKLSEARSSYARARQQDGFIEDAALAEQLGAVAGPALLSIAGGKTPRQVIPLTLQRGTRFTDVVGMEALKKSLRIRILEPFLNPGLFSRFAKKIGGGILLYGPPGCGKTLIARALAGECNAQFVAVGISDILNMWIGESERNIAEVFEKARASRPSVLFFDELDALAFSRAKSSNEHTRRLVDEFLQQLDGFSASNEQVLVLGATNMPWDVDSAMKRPGRFDRQVFIPPPEREARMAMFQLKLADVPTATLDLDTLSAKTEHFSGADIDGVVEQAKENVLADILEGEPERPLRQSDLLAALQDHQPSTLDWLRTVRNIVKFGGDKTYKEVDAYLKQHRLS